MKIQYIHKCGSKHLILLFGGWASDVHLFEPYVSCDKDLVLVYDYRDLSFDALVVNNYDSIEVFAWSMGVWAVQQIASQLKTYNINRFVAINGTPYPLHDTFGIPHVVFKGTLDGLNASGYQRFQRRMFGGSQYYKNFKALCSQRSLEDVREELQVIYTACFTSKEEFTVTPFTEAWIARQDTIFPVSNQERCWTKYGVTIHWSEGPHYDALLFKSILQQA